MAALEEELLHRPFWGPILIVCLVTCSSAAHAFDCTKAYLAVDFVICSDPAVLKANEAHEKAWYDARARLNDAEKQELLTDQRQWLKEFPPRCGIPAKGKPLPVISKNEQLCVAEALEERRAFLERYHNPAVEAQSATQMTNQPAESQINTATAGSPAAASGQPPSVEKQSNDGVSVDISTYTCRTFFADASGKNDARLGTAIVVAYIHAHDKLFPNDPTYNLGTDINERFGRAVGQNCAAGELSRSIEDVVAEVLEQHQGPAAESQTTTGSTAAGAQPPPEAKVQNQPAPAPTPTPIPRRQAVNQSTFIGCYADLGDSGGTVGRDLDSLFSEWNDLTTEKCVDYCRANGFDYGGTQYGRQCFCGNVYGKFGSSSACRMPCAGNPNETCGGFWANSVYNTKGRVAARGQPSLEAKVQNQPAPAAVDSARSQPGASEKNLPGIGSMDCAKFTSLASSELNSMFGTTNYSGSWVPAITNIAKGDSQLGSVFRNILAHNSEAGNSIAQLMAAFLASGGGGYSSLLGMNSTTLRALLLGLALEPQSIQSMDSVVVRAAINHYGVDAGMNAVRNLAQEVIDQVSEGAGQQSNQVRTMLQANLGASGKICMNDGADRSRK